MISLFHVVDAPRSCRHTAYVLVIAALVGCGGEETGPEGGAGGAVATSSSNATSTANATSNATSTATANATSSSNATATANATSSSNATSTASSTTNASATSSATSASSSGAGCAVTGCTGDPRTSWSFGDDSYQTALAVAAGPQGELVVAFTGGSAAFDLGDGVPLESGAYVAKLDATHAVAWRFRLGVGVLPTDVAIDGTGAVTVVGHAVNAFDFGGGTIVPDAHAEGFVLRLTEAGAFDALVHFGSSESDPADGVYPLSVALDPAGDTILSGNFYGDVTFGSATFAMPDDSGGFILKLDAQLSHVFSRAWPDRTYATVDVGPNGDVVASSAHAIASYLTRLDAAGNVLSDFSDPDAILDGQRAAFDPAGNSVVAGHASSAQSPIDFGDGPHPALGSYDGYVVKRDPAGNVLWSQQLGHGNASIYPGALAIDAAGDVVITGLAQGGIVAFAGPPIQKASSNRAAFVVKLSGADGSHVWSRAMFGPGIYDESQARAVAIRDGNPIVVGNFKYQIDPGGGLLTCNGNQINSEDVFVAEYAP